MTLIELYNLVGSVALSKPNVNTYFSTSPYYAWNTTSIEYASVAFTVESFTDDAEMRTYRAILYYGDRLEQDGSNWMIIQDNTQNILWSIIDGLREADGIAEVEYNYTVEFFNQKFVDHLAGGYVELNISIPIDTCLNYD